MVALADQGTMSMQTKSKMAKGWVEGKALME